MASHLPHNDWVVNRHFTSRCDFCDMKNTVLQHCDAPGCHINICEFCMRTGVLAEDGKHRLGRQQADRFEWQRRILPREDGPKTRPSAKHTGVHTFPPSSLKPVEGRGVSYTIPTPRLPNPGSYGSGPVFGTIDPQTFPTLPLSFPSGPMYLGHAYPLVAMPNFQPFFADPDASDVMPRLVPCTGQTQPPIKEPEVKPKTGTKYVRKALKRQAEAKSSTKANKRQRRGEVAAQKAPSAGASAKAADQNLDESEEVIEAANILMAMSQGSYATDPLATPRNTVSEKGPVTTPVVTEQSSFLPTPCPSAYGPKSRRSKRTKVAKTTPTPDEDVPWNPIKQRFPITRAQWNEQDDERGQEGLSARAQALRNSWGRITTTVRHQFGLDDDEELFPAAEADQFRLAWQRMMACMPDESAENRLNRAIAVAVLVEIETLMEEALAPWK